MAVRTETHGAVGVITLDNPPVNAFDQPLRQGLFDAVVALDGDPAVKAIVIACAGRTFAAGANINEFDTGVAMPHYRDVFNRVEQASKPVVAALFGTALGAGLELAVACHWRVATADARLGLPEINLGIVPGAGGTQRLPRLVGVGKAMNMMLTGTPIGADAAMNDGLVDAIVATPAVDGAVAFAERLIADGTAPRRTGEMKIDAAGLEEAIAASLKAAGRRLAGRTTQHGDAEAVRAAAILPFAAGLVREREISDAALASGESKALRHLFLAERWVARVPGLPRDLAPLPLDRIAIVGGGTMGSGIATSCVNAGLPVTILETDPARVERGLGLVRANLDTAVKRGLIGAEEAARRGTLITGTTSYADIAAADLVIEAVFENMEMKKKVFAELDKAARPGAVLATNTSTLDIDEIAAVTQRPQAVLGLHYFAPAHVMRLLEIVRAVKTDSAVLATGVELAKKLRKVGVVVGVCFGFAGNRMFIDGYMREVEVLLLEGAAPERIDRALTDWGMAMGPNGVNDLSGTDILADVRSQLLAREHRPEPYLVVTPELAKVGRLGIKAGKGVYRYGEDGRTPHPDPETAAIIRRVAEERQVRQRADITDAEIVERTVLQLVNVGAHILDEGIAARPADLDVIFATGYGFGRQRGGPMHYADQLGLPRVLERMRYWHERYGEPWRPAPLIERLVQQKKSFADLDRESLKG
ncbi:MAG: 3-hydroxyacyl-CoA dehydrogenase [Alphaproteobacteria bacterium]|nr:3-hydroxyacyl-CoA dehydrogenase [Alphaproteobacteria bacterium]